MLQRYLMLWLLLSSLAAACWPIAGFDPFTQSKPALGTIVALTMLCVGSLLPRQEVHDVARRWPLIAWGTLAQYGSMPLLAWLMAELFQLHPDMRIGVILAGCVPGAMASNVLTMTAKGNVSYSVGLTTAATLVSPLVVPLAMRLTLGTSIPTAKLTGTAIALGWQVVLPVMVGFLLSQRFSRWQAFAKQYAGSFANIAILWIIACVVALNRNHLAQASGSVMPALLGLNLLGYGAGALAAKLGRLPTSMSRALILEVGMQNAGVGASIAIELFQDRPQVALPCALYAFGCMLTGTLLAHLMAAYPIPSLATQNLPDDATV